MKRLAFIIAALCISGALAFTACTPESVIDGPDVPEENAGDNTSGDENPGKEDSGREEPEPQLPPLNFTSFSLEGRNVKASVGQIGDTCVLVVLPPGANSRSLTASFDAGDAKVYAGNKLVESGSSSADYALPVRYTLKTPDGRVGNVTVSVVFRSDIPTFFIYTGAASLPSDTETWIEGYRAASVNPDGTSTVYGQCSMKGRGNSSWWYPKKPYNIKLKKRQEVLGMAEHKRWCLLANWMDRTSIRNDVAFEIARRTSGLAWTPHGKFVNLIINGVDKGMYYVCEQIRIDENRVDITEMKSTDKDDYAISGGYLLECDVYYDEKFKFHTTSLSLPFMVKQPDEDVMTQAKNLWIKNYCSNVESRLVSNASDGSYRDFLDRDSFIDFWFVQELTGNGEPNHPKSCYMYKDRGGKLFAGPVWDFDWNTFNSNNYSFIDKYTLWYGYLFQDPSFKTRTKIKWNESYDAFAGIPDYIDEIAAEIRVSALANSSMWPINQDVNGDETLSYDEAVQRLKDNYTARLKYLDGAIRAL